MTNIRKTADLTFDELYDAYINHELSQQEVAEKLNSTVDCVAKALKMFNIKRTKDQARAFRSKHCKNQLCEEKKIEKVQKAKKTLLSKYGDDYYTQWSNKVKKTVQNRYSVDNVMQSSEIRQLQTQAARHVQHIQHDEILQKRKQTVNDRYGVDNVGQCTDHVTKMEHTSLEKFGAKYYSSTEECKTKVSATWKSKSAEEMENIRQQTRQTCIDRYGVPFPPNDKFRRVLYYYDNILFDSSFELYYYIWAVEHNKNIRRCNHKYAFIVNNVTHYYFPDFTVDNVDVEIKGEHFFDEGGNLINPFTNNSNIQQIFLAKGNCMKEHNIMVISDITEQKTYVDNKYSSNFVPLFRTDLTFPYLNSDFANKTDMGVIQHFHKSIYDANRYGYMSPKEAWSNKTLVKRCALNRLKYVQSCKPSDILQGFNVAKIAPKVSVFSPKLAIDLITKYIKTDTIVDPFSGFSGRLIGAIRCKKNYQGFDINETHVEESNQIIEYFGASNTVSVTSKDLLTTQVNVYKNTTLFTCPPYEDIEHWNVTDVVKSCDEWIDECMSRYICDYYLFVVDKTIKYNYNIIETIENKSHLGTNNEFVVLIKR